MNTQQRTGVLYAPALDEDALAEALEWERTISRYIKSNQTLSGLLAAFAVQKALTVIYPCMFSGYNKDNPYDFGWDRWYDPSDYYEDKTPNMVGGLIYRGPSQEEWKEMGRTTPVEELVDGSFKVEGWTSHT